LGGEADQPKEGGADQAPRDLPKVVEEEAAGQGEGAEQADEVAEQAEEQAAQADEAEQAQGVAEQAEEPVVGPQPRAAPEAVLRPDLGPRPRAAPVAVLRPRPRSRSPRLREARPARAGIADAATLVGTFGFLGPRVGPPRGPGWQSRPVRIDRRGCGVGRSASRGTGCPGRWAEEHGGPGILAIIRGRAPPTRKGRRAEVWVGSLTAARDSGFLSHNRVGLLVRCLQPDDLRRARLVYSEPECTEIERFRLSSWLLPRGERVA
jgi:hypothetical protein